MSILKTLKPISALVVLAGLVGCIDPQVGVRRTGAGSYANSQNRVPSRPVVGSHIVQKGETLYAISFKYAVDFRDIARWNHIAEPYTIYPNQRLLVRDPSAPALTASAVRPNPGLTTSTPSGVVVSKIPEQTNARSQSINAGTPVEVGNGVSVAAIATPAPLASTQPLVPEAEIVAPADAIVSASPSGKPPAGRNGWGWPLQGKLISTFASADPARQGIDIAGNYGDPVYCANAGEVVYSGRGIIGYGELIVIKHDNATLTAYGHNRRRLVKEGQRIRQGEIIAEMGRDRQGRALLHFELRRNGKPVDPLGVLPARAR